MNDCDGLLQCNKLDFFFLFFYNAAAKCKDLYNSLYLCYHFYMDTALVVTITHHLKMTIHVFLFRNSLFNSKKALLALQLCLSCRVSTM